MKLTDAMNTYNPALEKMSKMGYKISIVENEESFDWEAKKDDAIFIAADPLRLLGLISIREEFYILPIHNHYDEILKLHFKE